MLPTRGSLTSTAQQLSMAAAQPPLGSGTYSLVRVHFAQKMKDFAQELFAKWETCTGTKRMLTSTPRLRCLTM